MIPGLEHTFGQATNILSGKPKDLTKTSTTTGGSALGEEYGTYGMDQYKGMMDPTAFTGNVPGAQGPNAAQKGQYNMLTGMHTGYGAPGGYQGMYQNLAGQSAQQLGPMNRAGGPGAGYMNPYQKEMLAGVDQDMERAMQMAANTESAMTGDYMGTNVGGPSAARSRNKLWGEQGDIGLQAAKMKSGIRGDSFDKGMRWLGDDQNRNIVIANANNQGNLDFGGMNMRAASGDINNQMNMANLFGNYGLNRQNQQNMADAFNYGEFNRMQDWKPNMMNRYMSGLNATPWQTTSTNTATGQGKSDLNNLIGMGVQVGAMKMMFACIPEGTKIDTLDGPIAIEDIKAGTKVKGYYKAETEVLQVHQYKEDPKPHRFYRIKFDNGGAVDCCDMHRIYNKRAQDYKVGDRIQNTKVTSITRYNGVERSYDLLTIDGGYLIGGVPVNSMIEEMASYISNYRKAA